MKSNIDNRSGLVKSKMKMTTKELLRKQVIILMDITIAKIIINQANSVIANINISFKNLNSKTIANFIKLVDSRVIINTNQVASSQDISVIIKMIKDTINVNLDSIENLYLLKFKSYLKIISLSYYVKTTNTLLLPL